MEFKACNGCPGYWGCPLMTHFVESFVCLFIYFILLRKVSFCSSDWMWACGSCPASAPECWDGSCEPPCLAYNALRYSAYVDMLGKNEGWWEGFPERVSLTPLYLFIYCVCSLSVHAHTCATACMWRSEDIFQNSGLTFFPSVSSESWTVIVTFGSKHLYLLGHLNNPDRFSENYFVIDLGLCWRSKVRCVPWTLPASLRSCTAWFKLRKRLDSLIYHSFFFYGGVVLCCVILTFSAFLKG